MAKTQNIRIEGMRELNDFMGRELTKAAAKGALRRALIPAAQPMARKARALAPDDPRTFDMDRDLRESIEVSTKALHSDVGKAAYVAALQSGASKGAAVSAMKSARQGGAFVEVYMGPVRKVFHGIFQEFGTINHAPQAFMRPAFDSDARPMLMRLKVEMADEIGKAAARAKKKAAKKAAAASG